MTIDDFNKAVCETGEKSLGSKKKEQKDWIQVAGWEKVEKHRTMKQKMNSTKSKKIKNHCAPLSTKMWRR